MFHELKLFCKKHDLRRQLTIRKTSKQNDSAKRKNRIKIEMDQNMFTKRYIVTSFFFKDNIFRFLLEQILVLFHYIS